MLAPHESLLASRLCPTCKNVCLGIYDVIDCPGSTSRSKLSTSTDAPSRQRKPSVERPRPAPVSLREPRYTPGSPINQAVWVGARAPAGTPAAPKPRGPLSLLRGRSTYKPASPLLCLNVPSDLSSFAHQKTDERQLIKVRLPPVLA